MTESKSMCDRCGKVITEDRSVLKVETGPLRHRWPEGADLCAECCEWLVSQIRPRPAAGATGSDCLTSELATAT
jgi:hypothetical protein